jgi:hypothetical protein
MGYKSSRRNFWILYLLSLTGIYIIFIDIYLRKDWDLNLQNTNLWRQRIKLLSCKSVQPEDDCISVETCSCLMWIHSYLTINNLCRQRYSLLWCMELVSCKTEGSSYEDQNYIILWHFCYWFPVRLKSQQLDNAFRIRIVQYCMISFTDALSFFTVFKSSVP